LNNELLMRSRIFLFERRGAKPHILTNSTNESSRVSFATPYSAMERMIPSQRLKSVSMSRRDPVIFTSLYPSLLAIDSCTSSSVASVTFLRLVLLLEVDFSVGTNRPSLMSATGCTVLALLTSSLTTSPVVLSIS